MKEKCNTPYCRGEVVINYLGKLLCQNCYERICDEEDAELRRKDIMQEVGGI